MTTVGPESAECAWYAVRGYRSSTIARHTARHRPAVTSPGTVGPGVRRAKCRGSFGSWVGPVANQQVEVEPDTIDPEWQNVQHDTKTLDCIGGEHNLCRLAQLCQCGCHATDQQVPNMPKSGGKA